MTEPLESGSILKEKISEVKGLGPVDYIMIRSFKEYEFVMVFHVKGHGLWEISCGGTYKNIFDFDPHAGWEYWERAGINGLGPVGGIFVGTHHKHADCGCIRPNLDPGPKSKKTKKQVTFDVK